jgi:hypothetical protein
MIGSLVFTGDGRDILRIDDVTFAVPEPSTAAALLAAAALSAFRRPTNRRATFTTGCQPRVLPPTTACSTDQSLRD